MRDCWIKFSKSVGSDAISTKLANLAASWFFSFFWVFSKTKKKKSVARSLIFFFESVHQCVLIPTKDDVHFLQISSTVILYRIFSQLRISWDPESSGEGCFFFFGMCACWHRLMRCILGVFMSMCTCISKIYVYIYIYIYICICI